MSALRQPQDQYLRKIRLILFNDKVGLDLSQFRIQFRTTQTDGETPNIAMIRVYNLRHETGLNILAELTTVSLEAGYQEGNFGIVYSGKIAQFKVGRMNATDTYLDIFASDGADWYLFGTMNVSLPAGQNGPKPQMTELQKAFQEQGVKVDPKLLPDDLKSLGGTNLERGKVMAGVGAYQARQFARNTFTTWSIQNGQMTVIKKEGYLPGTVVVVNSGTGMIGQPEATVVGVNVKILLNPNILIGQRIKINNRDINQTLWPGQVNSGSAGGPQSNDFDLKTRTGFPGVAQFDWFTNVTEDGIYRVMLVEHNGDSRGNDWYTDITALAVDPTTGIPKDLPKGGRPVIAEGIVTPEILSLTDTSGTPVN